MQQDTMHEGRHWLNEQRPPINEAVVDTWQCLATRLSIIVHNYPTARRHPAINYFISYNLRMKFINLSYGQNIIPALHYTHTRTLPCLFPTQSSRYNMIVNVENVET